MSPNTPDAARPNQPEENGPSTSMLDAATYGQVLDDNNASGQEKADELDDSLRNFEQEMGQRDEARGNINNPDELPKELTNPSDRAFTLPEEQGPN